MFLRSSKKLTVNKTEEENSDSSYLPANVPQFILLQIEFIHSSNLNFFHFIRKSPVSMSRHFEKGLFHRNRELLHGFIILRSNFQQLSKLKVISTSLKSKFAHI
jgi:hypothetical protein